MIDQFEVAIATALWRHNEVINMFILKDSDVIIYSNFHQCIDSFFLICNNACQKFYFSYWMKETAKPENGKSVRSTHDCIMTSYWMII